MCGLPSNTLGAQAFLSGGSGYLRDKVFGRGTSQKLVNLADKAHSATIGKVAGNAGDGIGFLPGSVPGPNKHAGNIDFAEEKRLKKFSADEAERNRIYKSLGQTNAPQSILGG